MLTCGDDDTLSLLLIMGLVREPLQVPTPEPRV
jgi:hypothetical protein